jgi:hypothetical protein
MKELNFDSGVVTYRLNGKYELSVNPSDVFFVEKLYGAFEALDQKQGEYQKAVEAAKGNKTLFDVAHQIDCEMREIINQAFGQDICTPLFDEVSVYAISANTGMPVWMNLMFTVLDEIDGIVNGAQKKASERLKKYTSKYHR